MDAREAREWLSLQTIHADDCDFRHRPNSQDEFTPMTDEQWQKAKRLVDVIQARFAYHMAGERGLEAKREVEFVKAFIQLPYDYPLNSRQSQLLERIWVKYRRFHYDILAQPRWIDDYHREWMATSSEKLYMTSEIGHFNDGRYALSETYEHEHDPANDEFTIQFLESDDVAFWSEL